MPKPARAAIPLAAVAAAVMALAVMLADPAGDAAQAFAQHELAAAVLLIVALASAILLGIVIGRDMSAAAAPSLAAPAAPSPIEPPPARAQAQAMTPAETEFLANMSHELRTPLNAVIGFAELILSDVHGPLGDRRYADYVGCIRTSGERLLVMVDAILDLSQIAAGQLGLRRCCVEPQAIVEECARSVAAQAEAAKVELTVRPSTAPPITADPDRLKQALINLLSNAVKFTSEGGRISIGASGQDGAVAFEVTDTGIGMTPGQVDLALQPFRVIEGSMTRRHGGLGLGLPLAERLVRLHGGELHIDSRPGGGTSVTATLPVKISSQQKSGSAP